MQTTIYLIRHGEVHNPQGIIYGRLPGYGLSEKGKKEVEKSAEFLADKQIDTIYASPQQRTKESAEIIRTKLNLSTVHIADEINETLTSYQGEKFSNLDSLQSEVYIKPLSPTDETIEQIAKRMMDFIKGLLNKHPGECIAVVSHGDPIMALKAVIKHTPLEFIPFKTDQYVQHAEIYEIIANDQNALSIKNAFIPQ